MRVVLISWSPETAEAVERLSTLAEEVDVVAPKGPVDLKPLAADPPDAFVLDLDRLFVGAPDELDEKLPEAMAAVAGGGSLWIAWPKGGKGGRGDLTQLVVRERGMAAGWVDYKIASLDDTWSALRFTKRD